MANPRKFSEKIALLNQKQAEETVRFEQIMKEVSDVTSRTALSNLEEMQQNQMAYRQPSGGPGSSPGPPERGRNHDRVGGPMRSRPMEKRHDTSPYSGQPYLSPPNIETWRRTNSDSALHQSANEACQGANSSMGHRRGSDAYQQRHASTGADNRDSHLHHHHHHHGFIERPRSSCEMPRVPGINIYPSSQPPGQQIPIGNNTGSLPDLSNVHFSSPLSAPLDQEDHSSGSQYSNNRLSVPVNHRFLPSCKQGLTVDNNTSSSQQDVRITYTQQTSPVQPQHPGLPQSQPQNIPGSASPGSIQQISHSPGHYVYQQPHSPIAPTSPNSQLQMHQQNAQGQFNSLSYRTSQMVNRPSPQSSPSLTFQGSPLSYSNNPSAPSSPTSHISQPSLSLDPATDNVYINQVHADFEQFTMMDSPSTTIGPYINSPSHTGTYTQAEILNVGGELTGGDGGYYSTSPLGQLAYQTRTTNTTQQMTPQTPNTPTIVLTDCSLGPDDLGADFGKDFGSSIASFSQDFPLDDPLVQDLNSLHQEDINALRNDLDPLDLEELQRLTNADMVVSDPVTEDNFRLEQR